MRQNRVIHKSAILADYSIDLSDPFKGSAKNITFLDTDKLYIGSELPFNHKYFDVTTVNAVTASVSVEYWSGSVWIPAVDIIDETAVSGVTLAQAGRISWSTDYDKSGWTYDDTEDMDGTDLEILRIRGLYWARFSFSDDLTSPVGLNYVGHKFSDDEHLVAEYPELSRSDIKTAFKAGKTDWKDQSLVAGQYILSDLKELGVIQTKDQILDWEVYRSASVHKTAEIIFRAFGDDYDDQKVEALKQYRERIKVRTYRIDENENAILDPAEKPRRMGYLTR